MNTSDLFQVLSKWLIKYPDTIQTGNSVVDSVFTVLLSTTILVGGALGCFLDNIIPGIVDRDIMTTGYMLIDLFT